MASLTEPAPTPEQVDNVANLADADGDIDIDLAITISFRQIAIAGMPDIEQHNLEVEAEIEEEQRQFARAFGLSHRPCEQRIRSSAVSGLSVRRGRAPRAATNQRRRGSLRRSSSTSSRGDSDVADSDEPPGGRRTAGVASR